MKATVQTFVKSTEDLVFAGLLEDKEYVGLLFDRESHKETYRSEWPGIRLGHLGEGLGSGSDGSWHHPPVRPSLHTSTSIAHPPQSPNQTYIQAAHQQYMDSNMDYSCESLNFQRPSPCWMPITCQCHAIKVYGLQDLKNKLYEFK